MQFAVRLHGFIIQDDKGLHVKISNVHTTKPPLIRKSRNEEFHFGDLLMLLPSLTKFIKPNLVQV